MVLRFDADPAEAAWIAAALLGGDAAISRTLLIGPAGYQAYARVRALPDPAFPGQSEADIDEAAVDAAPTDEHIVNTVAAVMGNSWNSNKTLSFLLWDGWPYGAAIEGGARFGIGGIRTYVYARGTMEEYHAWVEECGDDAYPPSFIWPIDRSWCFAYDVDAHFASVGGAVAAIRDLLDTEGLDVVLTSRDDLPAMYH